MIQPNESDILVQRIKGADIYRALGLLRPGEVMPAAVINNLHFLSNTGIWFRFIRDSGVDPDRTLRSFAGMFTDSNGNKKPFMAHYQASRELDLPVLQGILFAEEASIEGSLEEELEVMGMTFDTVHPFFRERPRLTDLTIAKVDPIVQVFDETAVVATDPMRVNGGAIGWSVELYPRELLPHLTLVFTAPITKAGK